jgi:CMP-N,N'-diacetyllegionaminic acid synthase
VINGRTVLAIIPARGGSKGLPGKNIRDLAGKPLIAWSIEAANGSKYIDRCVVSTDDNEIAEISREHGGDVPFIRPAEFAKDQTSSMDVVTHAIKYLGEQGQTFDYIVLLEPTSPLRNNTDIDQALTTLDGNRESAKAIVGVCKSESGHPAFSASINQAGLLEPYQSEVFGILRRQDIADLYFFEGTIYVSDTNHLLDTLSFYSDKTMPYIVPRWKSIEIDELFDMIIAEAVINNIDKFQNSEGIS